MLILSPVRLQGQGTEAGARVPQLRCGWRAGDASPELGVAVAPSTLTVAGKDGEGTWGQGRRAGGPRGWTRRSCYCPAGPSEALP